MTPIVNRLLNVAKFVDGITDVRLTGVFSNEREHWTNGDGAEIETGPRSGFVLSWVCRDIGYGELTFYNEAGKPKCDDESMSPEFVEAVLIAYARTLELTHR